MGNEELSTRTTTGLLASFARTRSQPRRVTSRGHIALIANLNANLFYPAAWEREREREREFFFMPTFRRDRHFGFSQSHSGLSMGSGCDCRSPEKENRKRDPRDLARSASMRQKIYNSAIFDRSGHIRSSVTKRNQSTRPWAWPLRTMRASTRHFKMLLLSHNVT